MAMTRINFVVPGLNERDALWLDCLFTKPRDTSIAVSVEDRIRILETAVGHLLARAKGSANLSEAKQYLHLVEILAEESIRLMVDEDVNVGMLLERVCRDFEHGDEQNEFTRIYQELLEGAYPV